MADSKLLIMAGVLIFGLIGDILAWIFAFSTISIVWNIIYLILLIIGTVGVAINEPLLLIAPLIGFIVDILIAIGGVYIISSGRDIYLITGNSLGRKCYRTETDNDTAIIMEKRKGAKILLFLFVFYIITQPIAAGLVIYVLWF